MTGSLEIDRNKVLTDITVALTKDAMSSGWAKVKSFFKDLDAETSIQYGTAYSHYLANTRDKNGKVKTLI